MTDIVMDSQFAARSDTLEEAPMRHAGVPPRWRGRPFARRFRRSILWLAKLVATLVIAAIATTAALMTWQYYVALPWTRNGAVRVQVANVASQISGRIIEIHVIDNQFVQQGDVLFVIDPLDFQVAVRSAKAQVDQTAADYQVKQAQSDRRQHLSNDATTPEEQQTYAGNAIEAKAAYDAATQQLAAAQLNLQRTTVRSPVNGYVTNLLLRVGDFAAQGSSNISVVDSDSFWIDGYFEETKLSQICLGDPVEAKLMSYNEPITGHVESITRGIAVSNAGAGSQGLPNVSPVYTWVQLAQRVPVRVNIDHVPPGIPLVSGMTATVTVSPAHSTPEESWIEKLQGRLDKLPELFDPPMPKEECLGTDLQGVAVPESLPADQEAPAPTPEQLEPGLVPAINEPPRIK